MDKECRPHVSTGKLPSVGLPRNSVVRMITDRRHEERSGITIFMTKSLKYKCGRTGGRTMDNLNHKIQFNQWLTRTRTI